MAPMRRGRVISLKSGVVFGIDPVSVTVLWRTQVGVGGFSRRHRMGNGDRRVEAIRGERRYRGVGERPLRHLRSGPRDRQGPFGIRPLPKWRAVGKRRTMF